MRLAAKRRLIIAIVAVFVIPVVVERLLTRLGEAPVRAGRADAPAEQSKVLQHAGHEGVAPGPPSPDDRIIETRFLESQQVARTKQNAASERAQRSPEHPASAEREVPLHWFVTGLGHEHYTFNTERAVVWNGSASAELTPIADAYEVSWGALRQAASAEPFRGKRIEFSAYLRTEKVQGGSGLWFRADDALGATVAFDSMSSRSVRENTPWARYSIVLDIPTDADSIHYGIVLIGRGSTWFDDARIATVDRSVKVTAPPIQPRRHPRARPIHVAELPSLPRNLDFEETMVLTEQKID